jgi:hypothetical protein
LPEKAELEKLHFISHSSREAMILITRYQREIYTERVNKIRSDDRSGVHVIVGFPVELMSILETIVI